MTPPRFLADEDLRFEIVLAAKRIEPALELQTVVETGLSGAQDADILKHAQDHGLVVVSHDVNTMKAFAEERIRKSSGISGLFLVPQRRPTRSIAENLVVIWAASDAGEWKNRVVYLPL